MDRSKQFIAEWERQTPHEMTSRMRSAFSNTLDWLLANPSTSSLRENTSGPDLDDVSELSIAKQFYRLFDTHFFKCQNSLLLASLAMADLADVSWLDQPKLWVLDIGAGTGAGTLGLLDILCEYQQYRWDHGYPITPREIHIIAIDPCRFALDVYSRMIEELSNTTHNQKIHISLLQIIDEFPKETCLERTVAEWAQDNPITLMVIASNVIRPLHKSWDRLKAMFVREDNQLELEMGDVLAKAYKYLIERLAFRRIIHIDIVTRNTVNGESLFDILYKVVKSILRIFRHKSSQEWWNHQENSSITFLNSPRSFHSDQGHTDPVTPVYSHSLILGKKNAKEDEVKWEKTKHAENLKLAHARTRNYMYYVDIVDEVEIKLADFFWEDYTDRLAILAECGDLTALGTQNNIFYAYPKNKEEDRPRYYLQVGEQLISAAISQVNINCFKPYKDDFILGDRLNKQPTEFFYERWNQHFGKYKAAIRNAAQGQLTVAKVDIRSFYTRIRQSTLYQSLRTSLGVSPNSLIAEILRSVVIRDLISPLHEQQHGLPQSGITAGLWASKYLKVVDQDVISVMADGKYFRYADDITLIDETDKIDAHISVLNRALDNIGLELNSRKEKRYKAEHYNRLYKENRTFRDLSRELRTLLDSLYFLPESYVQNWRENREEFLDGYSRSLKRLSIHLQPYWINRQLRTRDSIRHKIVHAVRGLKVKFPFLPLNTGEWANQFTHDNADWIRLRDEITTSLARFFRDHYEIYISPSSNDEEKQTARSAIRFSIYRLSILGISPIADDLVTILSGKPDLVISPIALRALVDCGRVDNVLELATQWQKRRMPENNVGQVLQCCKYLSATACWAFGFADSNQEIVDHLMKTLFLPESDTLERLMSSEALIRLQIEMDNHLDIIRDLLKQTHNVPALEKNLILLATSCRTPFADIYPTLPMRSGDILVHDAIQFALTKGTNILSVPEPREIERFYSKWYPDLPSDLHRKHSSSGS